MDTPLSSSFPGFWSMLGRSINLQSYFYAYPGLQLIVLMILAVLIGVFARRLERAIYLSLLLGVLLSNLTVLSLFMFTRVNQKMGDIFAILTLAPAWSLMWSLIAYSITSFFRSRKA